MKAMLLAVLTGLSLGSGGPEDNSAVEEVKKALAHLNAAFAKQDAEAIQRLTTADHVGVTGYYGGPQTRAEQLKFLKELKLTEYAAGKVTVKLLGKDTALVTYPLTLEGSFKGKPVPTRNFASALWVRRGGQWREAYYQETSLREPGKKTSSVRYELAPTGRLVRREGDKILWTARLDRGKDPQLLYDSKRVYVRYKDGVTTLAARTGIVLWEAKGPTDRLVLYGDQLLVTTPGNGGRWVVCRTVTTGAALSKFRLPKNRIAGVPLGSDWMYLSNQDLERISPKGVSRWRIPLEGRGGGSDGGFVGVGGDLVAFRYGPNSDSGVRVLRVNPANGKLTWRTWCAPLGIPHTEYYHRAEVAVEGDRLRVTSRGAGGTFVEILDLATGKRLQRIVQKQ